MQKFNLYSKGERKRERKREEKNNQANKQTGMFELCECVQWTELNRVRNSYSNIVVAINDCNQIVAIWLLFELTVRACLILCLYVRCFDGKRIEWTLKSRAGLKHIVYIIIVIIIAAELYGPKFYMYL